MRMSKERAPVQIVGMSPNLSTARKLQLIGVLILVTKQDAKILKKW